MTLEIPPLGDDAGRLGIGRLCLRCRTYNALKRAGIVDFAQIYQMGDALLKVPGLGKTGFEEIRQNVLREYSFLEDWPRGRMKPMDELAAQAQELRMGY